MASKYQLINPDGKWPDWSQPIGIHDAYPLDAQVTHVGGHWMSSEDNNIWEPGVHGWNHKA